MSRQQKYAWFILILFAISVVAYIIAMPFIGPLPALGAVGFLGFAGFGGPLFFRKKSKLKEPVMDERDKLIKSKAEHNALLAGYEWYIFACMGAWAFNKGWTGDATVPVFVLPLFVFGSMAAYLLVYAITVLVLYGRGKSLAKIE